ncbi:endonuclease MutS2 [Vermiculatibacterium agrestimuris]|uniref:endonuclease MutS2 n=1 Tax=Vermiculatibacterium agrestimuris TaxID=2941519 RepID=UPI00203F7104|nr:endonuclease MutS2 [Vermiculatibacterium agrestimuris]
MKDELFEKSMLTLELPKILELLANEAVTEEGKERCLALRPFIDADDVQRALHETSAAVDLVALRGAPYFGGVKPVRACLQRADMGGALNTRELLGIAAVLRCARGCIEYAAGGEKTPIDPLFKGLTANRFLEEQISGSILSEEEIADAASPELADIRRKKRAAAGKVRDILQKLISSNQSKYLQENIITQRNGRYVVPVKSEHKNDVPGLVHDLSASGGTFFIEPMGVVKANNELRELEAKEEKEIERILAQLSAECAAHREDIAQDYDLIILLDVVFAKAGLSLRMRGMSPRIVERGVSFESARHPLLDRDTAVRNDLRLGEDFDTLVVTGPNTGGKTVTLKTLGLLVLMAQCGLHIPAGGDSHMRVFRRVLSDIGDEQSIAQSLSTFSSHMTNIVGMLAEADEDTLILFDELGAGTDPVEGAALAAAVIEEARSLGCLVAATTHYAELKVYAMTTPGVENASCEFNVETLAPTYKLLIGIPGKSNAFAISRRLGLPEHVIDAAAGRVNAENIRFEDVLTQLDRQRQEMEKEKEAARLLRRETEEAKQKATQYRDDLEKQRSKAVERAQAEARIILEEARRAADETFQELDDMRKKSKQELDAQRVNEARTGLRRRLNAAEDALGQRPETPPPPPTRPAVKGDTVELVKMPGTKAVVLDVKKDGTLQLQAGILKLTASQAEVRVTQGETEQSVKRIVSRATHQLRSLGASPEVDLRGMTGDEAVVELDRFLDQAVMGKLQEVRIIHGKGTGAVRAAVREHLKRSRYVKSFRPGRYGEGEDGVTVAELK